jgi:hypothetical protein
LVNFKDSSSNNRITNAVTSSNSRLNSHSSSNHPLVCKVVVMHLLLVVEEAADGPTMRIPTKLVAGVDPVGSKLAKKNLQ